MSLPNGYTRLEYIESSGTQYIDTGVKPNNNTRVVLDAQNLVTPSNNSFLFGARTSASSKNYALLWAGAGHFRSDYNTSISQKWSVDATKRYVFDKNKESTTIDGTTQSYTNTTFQCDYSMYLFALNNAGAANANKASAKVYSCQIYDNGALVRAFVPCSDADGNVGLWDLVTETFHGNLGTGVFVAGPAISYARVEYIESTGTQYINTEFIPKYNTRVLMDVSGLGTAKAFLFGARDSASATASKQFTVIRESATSIRSDYFGTNKALSVSDASSRSVIDKNANVTTLFGGTITNNAVSSGECSYSMLIFTANNIGEAFEPCAAYRLYSCQIYDDGTLVRDFVPAVRQDGTVGLLDKVSGVFFENAGSGVFQAGPDVSYTTVEYVESTGTQYVDSEFYPNQDSRAVIDFQNTGDYTANTLGVAALFGSRNGLKAAAFAWWVGKTTYPHYGNVSYNQNGSFLADLSSRLIYEQHKNLAVLGGETISCGAATFATTCSFLLFTLNDAGVPDARFAKGKLYSCQLYDNGTLVRDYVPAIRENGQIGLIDQVSGLFYGNAGTGVFLAGPVVEPEPDEPEEPDKPIEPDEPEEPEGPVVPNGFECFGSTMSVAVLGWGASNGVQTYKLRRDGSVIYQGEDLCYTDTGLEPGKAYAYTVSSVFEGVESEEVPLDVETKTEMWLINDRTVRDLVTRDRKAFYNALDMIRVGEAVAYLERHLYDVGISIFVSPKLDWSLTDTPNSAQLAHYLADVRAVQAKLNEFRASVSSPESMAGFGFEGANNIETILLNTEQLILDIIRSYRLLCGRTISGVNALP